ncbi:hypothetical protein [Faecalicatena orotica]|nr:hypothetical protein [Faecalicatena orotica]
MMYTVVNSRAYEAENIQTGMQTWQMIGIGIDVILLLALLMLEVLTVRKYKKRDLLKM